MAPEHLRYTKDHEWVKLDGETATVGITEHAQEALGDLVFVDLPAAGAEFAGGDEMVELESSKAAASVYCPAAGKIAETNDQLADDPGAVNRDCYGAGWMVRLTLRDPSELDALMDSSAYETFLQQQET